ncbi:hypothetical protein EsH8_VIII_000799 [Colletotrichum jinshuiense]
MSRPRKTGKVVHRRRVPEEAAFPWFFRDEPINATFIPVGPTMTLIATSLVWRKLEDPYGKLYAEVQFADAVLKKQTRGDVASAFWQALPGGQHAWSIVKKYSRSGTFKRRVFVSVTHEGGFGLLAWKLNGRQQASHALLTHAFGGRNSVPCHCCEDRWRTLSVDPAKPDQGRVMAPFWECVSLPNEFGNACSNCLYHETAANCCFRDDDFYRRFGYGARLPNGTRRADGGGVPSALPYNIPSVNSIQIHQADLLLIVEQQRAKYGKSDLIPSVYVGTQYEINDIWAVEEDSA